MGLFGKKKDNFTVNVTRTATGKGYIVRSTVDYRLRTPADVGRLIDDLDDKTVQELPEAAAAGMIYSYCTIKYADPTISNEDALLKMLEESGYAKREVNDLNVMNTGSLVDLINYNLQYHAKDYIFNLEEVKGFYENLCMTSPIFRNIEIN